jgi:hypothetical protein
VGLTFWWKKKSKFSNKTSPPLPLTPPTAPPGAPPLLLLFHRALPLVELPPPSKDPSSHLKKSAFLLLAAGGGPQRPWYSSELLFTDSFLSSSVPVLFTTCHCPRFLCPQRAPLRLLRQISARPCLLSPRLHRDACFGGEHDICTAGCKSCSRLNSSPMAPIFCMRNANRLPLERQTNVFKVSWFCLKTNDEMSAGYELILQ